MTDFRRVTDQLSVAPQISTADLASAAAQGFKLVINNRPDGEDPAQPTSAEIEAAAKAAGLKYVHIPVRGGPTPDQVEADLMALVPAPYLTRAHHWLILHGRYTCLARRPKCEECQVADLCPSKILFSRAT